MFELDQQPTNTHTHRKESKETVKHVAAKLQSVILDSACSVRVDFLKFEVVYYTGLLQQYTILFFIGLNACYNNAYHFRDKKQVIISFIA